jgi:hypothetical protein
MPGCAHGSTRISAGTIPNGRQQTVCDRWFERALNDEVAVLYECSRFFRRNDAERSARFHGREDPLEPTAFRRLSSVVKRTVISRFAVADRGEASGTGAIAHGQRASLAPMKQAVFEQVTIEVFAIRFHDEASPINRKSRRRSGASQNSTHTTAGSRACV